MSARQSTAHCREKPRCSYSSRNRNEHRARGALLVYLHDSAVDGVVEELYGAAGRMRRRSPAPCTSSTTASRASSSRRGRCGGRAGAALTQACARGGAAALAPRLRHRLPRLLRVRAGDPRELPFGNLGPSDVCTSSNARTGRRRASSAAAWRVRTRYRRGRPWHRLWSWRGRGDETGTGTPPRVTAQATAPLAHSPPQVGLF